LERAVPLEHRPMPNPPLQWDTKGLEEERFPEVHDGGTDYCRAHYSLKARQLVRMGCNADA
jgi:hypothetical protein